MAGLRQSEIREKVQTYFKVQLDQYLDWSGRRGLSMNALASAREEMLDHESYMDLVSAHPMWLPVARFKNKMDVSDADWDASMPRIAIELGKGRRDVLRRVLEAVEHLEHYPYDDDPAPLLRLLRPLQRLIFSLWRRITSSVGKGSFNLDTGWRA